MNGELISVWGRTWQEVWQPLGKSPKAPDDLFVELVRGLAPQPQQPDSPTPPEADAFDATGTLVDVASIQERDDYERALVLYSDYRDRFETALNSESAARRFFHKLLGQMEGELAAVNFLESAYATLAAYGDEALTDRYRGLISKFIIGFSLRYEIRPPFSLHATMPGLFSRLISEIRKISADDEHLKDLFSEFEEAFSDLKSNRSQARIKTCLQKQFNLLEALGRKCPNVSETTLGAICNQLSFPHATIKEVGKKLYGFGSDYPGVRHAGNANGVIRQLDMRDFVSLSLMLVSFTPYVASGLDSDRCYTA